MIVGILAPKPRDSRDGIRVCQISRRYSTGSVSDLLLTEYAYYGDNRSLTLPVPYRRLLRALPNKRIAEQPIVTKTTTGRSAYTSLLTLDQKVNFNANCTTRADSPVAMTLAELGVAAAEQQVRPKAAEVINVEPSVESRGDSKFA